MTDLQSMPKTAASTQGAWLKIALAGCGALLLAGCATYRARPLPTTGDLSDQVPASVNQLRLELPPLQQHRLDPAQGLDSIDVAMLAVANNPELKAKRRQLGVARAQLYAAHLLPDPQLSFSLDHPTSSGPGLTNGQSLGLSYDLMALIDHSAQVSAARGERRKSNLEVLWREWQVAQKARQLYFKLLADQQKVALLNTSATTQRERYDNAQHQLQLGNITLETLSSDLTGFTDIQSQLYQARLDLSDTRHQLNALLGLKPGLVFKLKAPVQAVPDLPSDMTATAAQLIPHRPDLLALRAGYRSQEARVRKAILNQFPSVNLGVNEASDTSNVHTIGLGLQLNLPLWDRNRGAIAVQRATRAALRQAYQARIDRTLGDMDRLRSRFALLRQQYRQLQQTLPTLQRVYRQALKAYRAGNFSSLSYLNIQNTLLKKETDAIDLRLALWDARISLETLLGWPVGAPAKGSGQGDPKEHNAS